MKVAAYVLPGNGLSERTCSAMIAGAKACGEEVALLTDKHYRGVEHDAVIFWGFVEQMQKIMNDYNAAGKPAVFLDLAWWERNTHLKVSVGARHPTAYFQKVKHDDKRRPKETYPVKDWHTEGTILVAGMGPKAAWAEKCEPVERWEKEAIATLKQHTDRYIVYRPKPSQNYGKPIPGTELDVTTPLATALAKSWAVVTHHSNCAVDGLILGTPAFTQVGVSLPMGLSDLSKIESPRYPDGREQWLNDISYCQWSLAEMSKGRCWQHLKDEKLV